MTYQKLIDEANSYVLAEITSVMEPDADGSYTVEAKVLESRNSYIENESLKVFFGKFKGLKKGKNIYFKKTPNGNRGFKGETEILENFIKFPINLEYLKKIPQLLEKSKEELGELEGLKENIEKKNKELGELEKTIDKKKEEIENNEKEKREIEPYKKFLEEIRTYLEQPKEEEPPQKDFSFKELLDAAKSIGLPQDLLIAYLLSFITSLVNYRFLLLAGTVGVGKSRIIKQTNQLLGYDKPNDLFFAVRPGWLDPSDLLGFFDPLEKKFRPTPFTKTLLSLEKNNNDDPCIVLLDEMNLARVENYAADLLSVLGSNQQGDDANSLRLYEQKLPDSNAKKVAQLMLKSAEPSWYESTGLEPKAKALFEKLMADHEGEETPPTVTIGNNIAFAGTLNIDDSTESLSPKMVDRSFLLRFPAPDLLGQYKESKLESYKFSVNKLRENIEIRIKNKINQYQNQWFNFYNNEINIINKFIIPLSYRVKIDYLTFCAILEEAEKQHNIEVDEFNFYFIYSRILPRINFQRNLFEEDEVKNIKKWVEEKIEIASDGEMKSIEEAFSVLKKALASDKPSISYQQLCG